MIKSIIKQKLVKFPPMSADQVCEELTYFLDKGWTIKTHIPANYGYSVVVFERTEEVSISEEGSITNE